VLIFCVWYSLLRASLCVCVCVCVLDFFGYFGFFWHVFLVSTHVCQMINEIEDFMLKIKKY